MLKSIVYLCVFMCVCGEAFSEQSKESGEQAISTLHTTASILVLCLGSKNLFPLPLQLNYFI